VRPIDQPDAAFARRFLASLPPELAASFTREQLLGVQRCFGLRHGGTHPLDVRRSVWTPFGRFYVVLLAGPERRAPDRRSFERLLRGGWRLGSALLASGALAVLVLASFGALLALKLLLGIDLVPGIDMLPDEPLIEAMRR
jgi:hypothetical protein